MATSSADNQTSQDNAIATAQPQELEFYCDVDGDEVAEKVRYYLASTTLRMQTAEPVWNTAPQPHWEYPSYATDGIVIQNAVLNGSDPVFRYYKNSGGALVEFSPSSESARREIVTVGISLRVNEQPHVAKGNVQLATVVELRQRYTGGLE
jgi:hypothetical protein